MTADRLFTDAEARAEKYREALEEILDDCRTWESIKKFVYPENREVLYLWMLYWAPHCYCDDCSRQRRDPYFGDSV